MGKKISHRQEEILKYIQKTMDERGYPPSVREIGEAVGLKSSSTVHAHLVHLEKMGYIRRDPTKPRAIELVGANSSVVRVPVVGRVAAGEPILAVENIEDTFPLPANFLKSSDNVFMLTIRGDSMINAGILDGDYIIVRQQNTAENGDIVVALLGDNATVKRFFKEDDCIRLQPENDALDPIRTKNVTILGKVIGLLRKID
ncbi:MAG TPA: transcriptional repressor LexA [Syntrophomonadaceae bacterium]|nr:transcriptional repressor LexA [Syntrophomonadaceae bacterium]